MMRPSSSNYDSRHEKKKSKGNEICEIPEDNTPSESSMTARSVQTASTLSPRNIHHIPELTVTSPVDPPKRNRIQEPQRTPRIQEPNALVIQFEQPDGHRLRKPSPSRRKSSERSSRRSGNLARDGLSGWNRSSGRRRSAQYTSDTRPTTRESTVIDYYSDDFDDTDTSSCSDYDDALIW
ncbi:hypothetical protein CAPTEDRAFT_189039 [Capitella teleta]|uniref:Uncharacterized protein n=1 Tax=Capitella teleta TaxID=283909 RepID=R7UTN1_CAPTE|nr:hypothetical protein CAPTEDRAFT_189039 [Capitella teleta]|eukprot:ELU06751.1 hypothetical protein CAPTEDRAFT_189039 [Capitella teleta]